MCACESSVSPANVHSRKEPSASLVVICSYVANPLAIYLNKALCGTTDFRLKVCGECEGQ